jgi:hypothetical protein
MDAAVTLVVVLGEENKQVSSSMLVGYLQNTQGYRTSVGVPYLYAARTPHHDELPGFCFSLRSSLVK